MAEPNDQDCGVKYDPSNSIICHPANLYHDSATESKLLQSFPVKFKNSNKTLVQRLAYPTNHTKWFDDPETPIVVSQWSSRHLPLPTTFPPAIPTVTVVSDPFDYSTINENHTAWYPNFAHRYLFISWNSSLLAQDELQTIEFPCLASIAQRPHTPCTVAGASNEPTPVLIQRAIRRCAVDTVTKPSIYGNAFSRASPITVTNRIRALDPPTVGNIFAMEALRAGVSNEVYTREEIKYCLGTAYAAFMAIQVAETVSKKPVELHIGYWGCGAYGGNKTLMVSLQILAARLAGIPRVFCHGYPDTSDAEAAVELIKSKFIENDVPSTVDDAVTWLLEIEFSWGVPDGN